jgi:glutamyl-tRNA synthetase
MIIEFTDLCRGIYRQDLARDVGDFIVRRADGVHAYQLAVVVDDAAMRITHVLRGEDLLDSTPRQLLLYKLLGLSNPRYSHVSLLIGEDGQRLSKRHGDVSITALRCQGAKAEKIVGYLAYKANLIESWISVKPQELVKYFELAKLPRNNVIVHTCELFKMI